MGLNSPVIPAGRTRREAAMPGGRKRTGRSRGKVAFLVVMAFAFAGLAIWRPTFGKDAGASITQAGQTTHAAQSHAFHPFGMFLHPETAAKYSAFEKGALVVVLGIAVAGLLYAALLVRQVVRSDRGTPKMQEIAAAVREGANAYLSAQFRKIGWLILI